MRTRTLRSFVFAGLLLIGACQTPPPRPLPAIDRLFPDETPRLQSDKADSTVVDIDGTLSMQGFARPASGKYGDLLQTLDRTLNNAYSGQKITYRRFGSRAEDLKNSEPVYVAASRPDFYKGTAEYATTRTDVVLRDEPAASIKIVITDLFQEKSDISSIEQALRASGFPAGKSVAIFQWMLDFDGAIYDYDVRSSKGAKYVGVRPLYFLVVASDPVLKRFSNVLAETWTGGKPNVAVVSSSFALNPHAWLKLAGLQRLAVLQQIGGSVPLTVLRPSDGCADAQFSATSTLEPSAASISLPPGAALNADSTQASLSRVVEDKDSLHLYPVAEPIVASEPSAKGAPPRLNVTLRCASIPNGSLYVLGVTHILQLNDLSIPGWVADSSAASGDFNEMLAKGDKDWGRKTLNLLPLVRDLLSSATHGNPLGSVYFYIDRR